MPTRVEAPAAFVAWLRAHRAASTSSRTLSTSPWSTREKSLRGRVWVLLTTSPNLGRLVHVTSPARPPIAPTSRALRRPRSRSFIVAKARGSRKVRVNGLDRVFGTHSVTTPRRRRALQSCCRAYPAGGDSADVPRVTCVVVATPRVRPDNALTGTRPQNDARSESCEIEQAIGKDDGYARVSGADVSCAKFVLTTNRDR